MMLSQKHYSATIDEVSWQVVCSAIALETAGDAVVSIRLQC